VNGAADPQGTRVFWAYKSKAGQAGLFDKVLCYDWSIKDRPWSLIPMSGQYLGYLAKPGLTLEALDAIAPGGLTVLGAAATPGGSAFGAGKVRLTRMPCQTRNLPMPYRSDESDLPNPGTTTRGFSDPPTSCE
jgi:hypothetical protein